MEVLGIFHLDVEYVLEQLGLTYLLLYPEQDLQEVLIADRQDQQYFSLNDFFIIQEALKAYHRD